MGASILTFLAGPWGAIIQKALLVITIVGVIYVGFSQYTHSVREAQLLRDQNAQIVQLQKDSQILSKKMDNVNSINTAILAKLDADNTKVIETHDNVTKYIVSPDAQKSNRETSDVIKNTIGMLKNEE